MPVEYQRVKVPIDGGEQTKTDPLQVEAPEVLEATNVVFTKTGGVQKRNGYDTLSCEMFEVQDTAREALSIPGLTQGPECWLRGEPGAENFTLDNDGNVEVWKDRSGNGNDFSQSTASSRPALILNAQNGRPAVEFDNTNNEYLEISSAFISSGDGEMFISLISTESASEDSGGWRFGGASGGPGEVRYTDSSDEVVEDFGRSSALTSSTSGAAHTTAQSWHTYHVYSDDGTNILTAEQNGTVIINGTAGSTSWPSEFRLGRDSNDYFEGRIGELLVFNRLLTGAERTSVYDYLEERWITESEGIRTFTQLSKPITPRHLTSVNDELVLVTDDAILSYTPTLDAWKKVDALDAVEVRAERVVDSPKNDSDGHVLVHNGLRYIAWSDETFFCYRVTDDTTGATVVPDTDVGNSITKSTADRGPVRWIAWSDNLVHLYFGATIDGDEGVHYVKFVRATIFDEPPTTVFKLRDANVGSSAGFDVVAFATPADVSAGYVGYWTDASPSVLSVARIDFGNGETDEPTTIVGSTVSGWEGTSGNGGEVVVQALTSSAVYIGAHKPNTSEFGIIKASGVLFLVQDEIVKVGDSGDKVANLGMILDEDENPILYYTALPSGSDFEAASNRVECLSAADGRQIVAHQASQVAMPLRRGGKTFITIGKAFDAQTNSDNFQSSVFVIDSDRRIVAQFLYGLYGRSMVLNSATLDQDFEKLLPRWEVDETGNQYRCAFEDRKRVSPDIQTVAVNPNRGVVLATLDFDAPITSAVVRDDLYVSGAAPTYYDGNRLSEVGAPYFNEELEVAEGAATGSIAAGTYQWSLLYDYSDSHGQRTLSAPITRQLTTAGGSDTVDVTHEPLTIGRQAGRYSVTVYRTQDGPGVIFYATGARADNVPSFSGPVVVDTNDDTTIATNEQIYTTSEIEELRPEGISSFTLSAGRVIANDTERPLRIQFSKSLVQGRAVAFNDSFVVDVDAGGGRITALAAIDQSLLIFKADRTLVMSLSNLPNNTGVAAQFDTPRLLTAEVGCIDPRTVVRMPRGIMFQSRRGIFLTDRSLSTSYVGAPMEAYNEQTFTAATLLQGVHQVRFLAKEGKTLVYHYLLDRWTTFGEEHAGVGATVIGDTYYWVRGDGVVFKENALSRQDGDAPYAVEIVTPWLSAEDFGVRQAVRRMLLFGRAKGRGSVTIEAGINGKDGFAPVHTFDIGEVLTGNHWPVADGSWPKATEHPERSDLALRMRIGKGLRKNYGIRFRIREQPTTESDLELAHLVVEVATLAGSARLSADRSI